MVRTLCNNNNNDDEDEGVNNQNPCSNFRIDVSIFSLECKSFFCLASDFTFGSRMRTSSKHLRQKPLNF